MAPLRIVFAGTPPFAVPALQALSHSAHWVVAVYTQPDRPAGRGRRLAPSAVKTAALEAGVPVAQPASFKEESSIEDLRRLAPDLMVVAAYGLILPPAVLAIPRLGCLNIHASLLPRWRGAAPIQRAILAGDSRTGIGIMQMEAGLDTGPVLLERELSIGPNDTAAQIHDRLAALGSEALLAALPGWQSGSLTATPQSSNGITYASKIEKREAQIRWERSAVEIDRQIRAFNPWPVAQTQWRGETLRIWRAAPAEESAVPGSAPRPASSATSSGEGTPGEVLASRADGIVVATGAGRLSITELQLAGRKILTAGDFINAHSLAGEVFG